MTTFLEMTAKYSGGYRAKLHRLLEPLQAAFGINYYFYLSISKTREVTVIGTCTDLIEEYFAKKMHLCNPLFHPKAKVASGVYIYDAVKQQSFQETMKCLDERYKTKHSFLLTKKRASTDLIFGFALDPAKKDNESLLLNNASLFGSFIDHFENEMQPGLQKMERSPVILQEAESCYEEVALPEVQLDFVKLTQFLHAIYNSDFTKRDFDCIKLLIEGKTAREIALALDLSVRTVEHRIELLKEKLHCKNRSELISRLLKINPSL